MTAAELADLLKRIEAMISDLQEGRALRPRVVTLAQAGLLLASSTSKIRALVSAGSLRTVTIGRRRLVPMTEIERLTVIHSRRTRGKPKVAAVAQAQAIRALAKGYGRP